MIVDTSAVLAIVFREPGFEALVDKLLAADSRGVGAPTLVETALVLTGRLGAAGEGFVDGFTEKFEVAVLPFGAAHWRAAAEAFYRFGKGRHPASLNFGDCLSYATAKLAGLPLLFVGADFARTDIGAA